MGRTYPRASHFAVARDHGSDHFVARSRRSGTSTGTRTRADGQLEMFGDAHAEHDARESALVQPFFGDDERTLAAELPSWIRLGTSSWTYPGWAGILYAGLPNAAALVQHGLGAYAAHPLLRTVGIDRSHYAPLSADELAAYAAQLPTGFRAVSKVWDDITTHVFPNHPRFGTRAGKVNANFLDPVRTRDLVLAPYATSFRDHAGPFVFEIPPMPRSMLPTPEAFARAVDTLLAGLPSQFRYAFELRNRELLTARYLDTLRAHRAAHVLNFWTAMPTVGEQLKTPGIFTAPFVVTRLMLPPFTRYEDKREEYAPFNRIVNAQLSMREDVVELAARASEAGVRSLFVLVGNKAEGSSPLTVFALARALAAKFQRVSASPRQP
jgi:uncharacterized protein YecE (DUF72 family)